MNMSTSNPSMGLVVDLRRASNGQNDTNISVAKTAVVNEMFGDVEAGLLLSPKSLSTSLPIPKSIPFDT
eukprot:CAMPEP_0197276880 /NCGR_PEP_ID=MMETSP1432-20130617/16116_1 /TAXON_ID=44447 /ORGANISM="Pseudo-nitzschia delicatissima, Strain UNC1205" /LENGTH=68 /DNA_ID=CAMNT_0042742989 /DNA_START=192 /DNA_END=398 /DNA_ORIENTATION=+